MDLKALLAKHNGDSSKALAEASQLIAAATQRAEVAEKRASGIADKLTLKVGEKGGIMLLGLQRFPVTLYQEQWLRVLENADAIRSFIKANSDKLKVKGSETATGTDATGTDGK